MEIMVYSLLGNAGIIASTEVLQFCILGPLAQVFDCKRPHALHPKPYLDPKLPALSDCSFYKYCVFRESNS